MKSSTKTLIIAALALLTSCTGKPAKPVSKLQERVVVAEQKLNDLKDNDFSFLVEQYSCLDTTVARKVNVHKEMSLLRAYLQQFEDEMPNMLDEIDYTKSQLSNLQDDIDSGVYSKDVWEKYLESEEEAVKRIEAQAEYFTNRFNKQKEIVKQLKKK